MRPPPSRRSGKRSTGEGGGRGIQYGVAGSSRVSPAGGALADLAGFRREMRRCLWRRPDALFELADAVLTAGPVVSLPYLSLEPVFRRGHGMVYQGLAEGGIDEEALRDLLVAWRPREWPLVFAVDASTYPPPAATAQPRAAMASSFLPGQRRRCGGGRVVVPVAVPAVLRWRVVDRAAGPGRGRGRGRRHPQGRAPQQIIAHSARLRAAGERRIPLYVHDAGYDEAPLTWDLRRAPGPGAGAGPAAQRPGHVTGPAAPVPAGPARQARQRPVRMQEPGHLG